jgi:adenylosuccinate synthase
MPVIAVIGAQWGDEGKGKIVDLVAGKADVVIRFSGGDNAGHTVVNRLGKFALHLIPSGIFSLGAISVIGNGVVINPESLFREIDMLNEKGVEVSPSRLCISNRAHLIMPYHLLFDGLEEKLRGGNAIGTTQKGIGPSFSDKTARNGIRVGDILDPAAFHEKLRSILDQKNLVLTRVFNEKPIELLKIYNDFVEYGKRLKPYICDTTAVLEKALKEKKVIMLEGAQGTMLDPDFGTYPYATSSSPTAGGACIGSGISPRYITNILGVFKAYCTRVGEGPFPTELKDEIGGQLQERGHEFGTTTGRARRCGWFDGVAAQFSHRINGFTGIAITKFDILDTLPAIKICTAYKLGGKLTHNFPASISDLAKCEPVYETMQGWQTPTSDIRDFKDLPEAAKKYVKRLEELVCCPANLVCVGPSREQTIEKSPIF